MQWFSPRRIFACNNKNFVARCAAISGAIAGTVGVGFALTGGAAGIVLLAASAAFLALSAYSSNALAMQTARILKAKEREFVGAARDTAGQEELKRQRDQARQDAADAMRKKSEFLANMSHEIRTPMNAVLGFAELMQHSELDHENRRNVDLIVQSGRSMMLLLNDILDLSKIEAGQIEVNSQAVSLDILVQECAQLHRASAKRKGLEFRLDVDGNMPPILTDGQRLRQILLNLIGNAVKFTDRGHIFISCQAEDEQVKIAIEDTGIGIAEAKIAQIFKPFAQAEKDTARRFGGSGLGLSISRELAQLLDGCLEAESEPGLGTRFTVTIPLIRARGDTCSKPQLVKQEDASKGHPLHPGLLPPSCHILLVEDHDINRMLVQTMLEKCGQRVSTAADGNEAIASVLESQMTGEPFDLVLMDIQMPECDGYQATRAIRQEGIKAEDLPIIALSANAFPEDVTASRKSGMQAHVSKPLDFAELVKVLQRWLPVHIVDETCEAPQYGKPAAIASQGAVDAAEKLPNSQMQSQWKLRKREALESIDLALRTDELNGRNARDLARLAHKLAGTAGYFGEDELAQRAAALERALRSGVDKIVRNQLARELLDAA